MPSSIVKREKLISPLHLVLIGALFAVAFLFLLPKQEAFEIAAVGNSDGAETAIGELDIAYLKARSAAGEQSLEETSRAVTALVRAGQVDGARELLQARPDVLISEQERFSLDFEIATTDYYAASNDITRQAKRLQLLSLIESLISNEGVSSVSLLGRAAELSAQLGNLDTTVQLYLLLAAQDKANADQWYSKCAQGLMSEGQQEAASNCLEQAIVSAQSAEQAFELKIDLFTLVSNIGNTVRQDSVLNQLVEHKPLSNDQREKLANAMLANNRPDRAHLVFQQLAQYDEAKRIYWLSEAAKWALASDEGLTAAIYIDEAASLTEGNEKATLLKQAEGLLLAAGDSEKAFNRLVERIENSPNDESLLREGIVLARQLNESDKAAQWNEQLVKINPDSTDAVETQFEIALAEGDLVKALLWSKRAVALAPESLATHIRYAQVSEWSGDPISAQREWQWIAERFPEQDHLVELVRLAELNRETDVAAATMRKLVMLTPKNDMRISRLVELYELEGAPMKAASLLNELEDKSPRAFTQRELARLYQRHVLYPEALQAWASYAKKYGRTVEESLNRMELSWRLSKPSEAADIAKHLIGRSHASGVSNYQVNVISELAWQYRIPELAELVRPHMASIKGQYETTVLSKRLIQSLADTGKNKEAIEEATRLWQTTDSNEIALTAMNLAFKTGHVQSAARFLEKDSQTQELRSDPTYWTLAASLHQKNGQPIEAKRALQQALVLEPGNTTALSGLLWFYIDAQDVNAIASFIEQHQKTAETTPELWSAFAIAHLQLGLPELSLTWFDRQLDRIEADYNMLLTFADALEYAGRAEPARKVRLYAIKRLRPALAEGSRSDQDELIRQYAQVLNRYGTAEDKERQARLMLRKASDDSVENTKLHNNYWREDIAISWLMATQRHEHARLVMAKLHEQRLQAPAWQELSLAMANNDVASIQQVINGTGPVSIGNHILALRQLGYDKRAYSIAKNAIHSAPTLSDRELARSQYVAMRNEYPGYSSGNYSQTTMNGLSINEKGFNIRYSLASANLGLAVDYKERALASSRYDLAEIDAQQDIALTLFHGNRRLGGELTAGYLSTDADGFSYALAKQHLRSLDGERTLKAELAYNEPSTASALLRLTAKQNRLTLGYEQALGFREYVKLQGAVNDISTRVQEKRIARGLAARMELGIRGAFGSNVWSTSVAANRTENDVVSQLPEELALSRGPAAGYVLADSATSLTLGGSFSRGGVQAEYPQASSPRYYLNANFGHTWPNASFGAQFDAGAGIRILGGDELSIGFTHDTQPLNSIGSKNDSTSVGVNYRYHF